MITVKINNFTEKELACRCCGKFNIDNDFLIKLQAFRLILNKPLTVNCACRCKKHNKEVGGVNTSLHECESKKASAVDVTNSNTYDIYNAACLSGAFNEVIWYKKENFVHLGCDPNQKGNAFIIK